ncbi:signal peptidase I [Actinobacteria bacterium IMCC26103]|nr:signal peptidase I [Actinobacteria bacterium IMCC26103]
MPRKGSLFREFPILVIVALAVSLVIKTFLVQFFYIPSGSMENTLQINDRVAVNKLPVIGKSISRGDVVVFRDPDNWLPEPFNGDQNKYIAKVKEAFVAVGVLPNPAKQYLVKRVIGVAGDKVECCSKNKKLMINGKEINEPYIFAGNSPSDSNFNVTVPAGKIWVMGDHRAASADSRFHQEDINHGMVPTSKVTGKVVGIIWPIKNLGIVHSFSSLK